jgi:opacity protein-like surface antigen
MGRATVLALAGCAAMVMMALQATASSLQVSAFYATSSSGGAASTWSDASCQGTNGCKPPPKVASFPQGQEVVDLYFATNYQGNDLGTSFNFTTIVRNSAGSVVLRCLFPASGTSPYGSPGCDSLEDEILPAYGQAMVVLWAPERPQDMTQSAYPDGRYRAELLVGGMAAASTTFLVGTPSAGTAPSAKAGPGALLMSEVPASYRPLCRLVSSPASFRALAGASCDLGPRHLAAQYVYYYLYKNVMLMDQIYWEGADEYHLSRGSGCPPVTKFAGECSYGTAKGAALGRDARYFHNAVPMIVWTNNKLRVMAVAGGHAGANGSALLNYWAHGGGSPH